jgi:threonine dehydrogenase-like Zn-dependent dehydrogenase
VFVDIYVRARDDSETGFLLGFHAGATEATKKLAGGAWRYGTNAQYASLPIENVHALNEEKLCGQLGYSIEDLLTIQSACVPYGGLSDANVKAGDTVIVAPATGTFGGAAVLTALAMGADVIACGRNQGRLDALVQAMGSPTALKTALLTSDIEKETAALAALAGRAGADVYIDFSPPDAGEGAIPHLVAGMGALRSRGTAVLMGGIRGMVSIPYGLVMFKNLNVRGRFMYDRSQLQNVISLAEKGRLKLGKAVGKQVVGLFHMDKFVEAMEEAEKNPGYANITILKPNEA